MKRSSETREPLTLRARKVGLVTAAFRVPRDMGLLDILIKHIYGEI